MRKNLWMNSWLMLLKKTAILFRFEIKVLVLNASLLDMGEMTCNTSGRLVHGETNQRLRGAHVPVW